MIPSQDMLLSTSIRAQFVQVTNKQKGIRTAFCRDMGTEVQY